MRIEKRSIDYIPEEERHGKPSNQFSLWFGINANVATIAAGAIAVEQGLNILWGIIAVLIGNLIGAVFMAGHSAQGPKLGVPQMIQSRAQFGVVGAILPLIAVIFMYIGFNASNEILGAQAIQALTSIPTSSSIILYGIVIIIITLIGYDLIHAIMKYFSVLFAIAFLIITIGIFSMSMPENSWVFSQFNIVGFLLTVSTAATWQLIYAPYVADYSRYLFKNTSVPKLFWYTYSGTVISASWMMILGVILNASIRGFSENVSSAIAGAINIPYFEYVMYVITILGLLGISVVNLYGAFMSTTTIIEVIPKLKIGSKTRFTLISIIGIIGISLGVWGRGDFMNNFSDLISILEYALVPWTAINLLDFYFLRKGEYSILDLSGFNGKYGNVNWVAIFAYVITIICELPFMNVSFYVGPIAKMMGGAELAWLIGLVLPVLLYFYPLKKKLFTSYTTKVESNKYL